VTVGGGASLGSCGVGATNNIAICSLGSASTIAANTTVTVELDGVTNETPAPVKQADLLTVSTTSDTSATSSPFPIVAAQAVSQPTVTNSSPTTAAGGRTDYLIAFTTSSTGGMSGKANSQITITLPSSANVRSDVNSSVTVGGGASLGSCGVGNTNNIAICSLGSASTIAANTTVTVELDGSTSETPAPSGATDTLTVATTSNTQPSTPGSFPLVPA
jgi:acyl-CoA hydrolase